MLDKAYHDATRVNTTNQPMDERREELRVVLIGHKADKAMEFLSWAMLEFGPAAGRLCQDLLFWDGKGHAKDGAIYKTEGELEAIGLSRHHQRKARKTLKARGILTEELRGVPPKVHFKLDLAALMQLRDPAILEAIEERENSRLEAVEEREAPDYPNATAGPQLATQDEGEDLDTGLLDSADEDELEAIFSTAAAPEPVHSDSVSKGADSIRQARVPNQLGTLGNRDIQKALQKGPSEIRPFRPASDPFGPSAATEIDESIKTRATAPATASEMFGTDQKSYGKVWSKIANPTPVLAERIEAYRAGELPIEEFVEKLKPSLWGTYAATRLTPKQLAAVIHETQQTDS